MFTTISDITSLAGIFISIVAIIGLIAELRYSRLSLQTQTLLDLESRFYSQEMKTLRQAAAKKLLAANPFNCELEDTLDFLHSVVMLIERGVIDKELAMEFYKYWIARYWLAAESYVASVRKDDDPYTYKKLENLARIIIRQNPDINYSSESMKIFLMKEAGLEEPKLLKQMPDQKNGNF